MSTNDNRRPNQQGPPRSPPKAPNCLFRHPAAVDVLRSCGAVNGVTDREFVSDASGPKTWRLNRLVGFCLRKRRLTRPLRCPPAVRVGATVRWCRYGAKGNRRSSPQQNDQVSSTNRVSHRPSVGVVLCSLLSASRADAAATSGLRHGGRPIVRSRSIRERRPPGSTSPKWERFDSRRIRSFQRAGVNESRCSQSSALRRGRGSLERDVRAGGPRRGE